MARNSCALQIAPGGSLKHIICVMHNNVLITVCIHIGVGSQKHTLLAVVVSLSSQGFGKD